MKAARLAKRLPTIPPAKSCRSALTVGDTFAVICRKCPLSMVVAMKSSGARGIPNEIFLSLTIPAVVCYQVGFFGQRVR